MIKQTVRSPSKVNVKVSPIYDLYVGECLLGRTLILSHWQVGWPGPLLPILSPKCFYQLPIRCRVDSE